MFRSSALARAMAPVAVRPFSLRLQQSIIKHTLLNFFLFLWQWYSSPPKVLITETLYIHKITVMFNLDPHKIGFPNNKFSFGPTPKSLFPLQASQTKVVKALGLNQLFSFAGNWIAEEKRRV